MTSELPYDPDRVAELMNEYKNASTRQERRKIETEVLEQTVWRVPTESDETAFATFSKESMDKIREHVETDDERVKAMLRMPYLKDI